MLILQMSIYCEVHELDSVVQSILYILWKFEEQVKSIESWGNQGEDFMK